MSNEVRAMPNVEYGPDYGGDGRAVTMPFAIWETLTPQGKRICRHVCASPGVELPGAGVVHPLSSVRAEASEGLDAIQAEEMAIRARGEHVVQQLAEQGAKL